MKFYCESMEAVLSKVSSSQDGLSQAEAAKRLEENGKNKLEIHGGIGSVSITVAE